MNTIILAAGIGNRLRPITENIPKCMVEIGGKSLLNWQIEALTKAGISKINIVTGHMYNKIINLENNGLDKIYYNSDYLSTNMVKSLLLAEDLFNSDLLISYSDIIYSSQIVSLLLNSKCENGIIVDLDWHKLWSRRFEKPLDDAETLIFDKDYNLLEIGEKTNNLKKIMAQYIGLMKFNKKTLHFISELNSQKKIEDNLYMTDLIRIFLKNNINIKVIPIKRGWLEIDSLTDLLLYKEVIQNQKKEDIFSIFS